MDLLDKTYVPVLEEICAESGPMLARFAKLLQETYKVRVQIDYSGCSLAPGWNVKFKKAGRSLCTVYPQSGWFYAMVVVGSKQKAAVEQLLPSCSTYVQKLYAHTMEGNGQRWLMIEVHEDERVLRDMLELIDLRVKS